jgi:hypothetical protein
MMLMRPMLGEFPAIDFDPLFAMLVPLATDIDISHAIALIMPVFQFSGNLGWLSL